MILRCLIIEKHYSVILTAALQYMLLSNCKSLGFNYLQIDCSFTILHKIILVMMKCHQGGCSDGRIPRCRKYKMPLCQYDSYKECDACQLNRPHNVTFKHCEDILLFLSLSQVQHELKFSHQIKGLFYLLSLASAGHSIHTTT